MSKILAGKLALVTGGSRNIGRETALALADLGADIVFTYVRNEGAAQQTRAELEARGVKATSLRVDLEGTAGLEAFSAAFTDTLKAWRRERFDILVNNAGTLRLGTFDKISEQDLDAIYQTNYKSVFFLTQRLLPLLADGGRVVNLGSGTARIAFGPLVSYGPMKAALQSLTLYLANFLGPRGITVNAVAPGGLDDDVNAPLFAALPSSRGFIGSNTAVGRLGRPNDVASVIAFLCTPAAAFVSGSIVNIEGGYHL